MKTKIERATEIHRSMTPHQMALRIVELEDIAEIVGQSASEHSKRITGLQDALELAEEAVRAKHFPDAAEMVTDGWQFAPKVPTREMIEQGNAAMAYDCCSGDASDAYQAMLAAAPKHEGGA